MKFTTLLLALALISIPSCETVNKFVGADTVEQLKKLWDDAPIVLETMYKGKVIRIVIKSPKTKDTEAEVVAIDQDGQLYSVSEVQKAASMPQ